MIKISTRHLRDGSVTVRIEGKAVASLATSAEADAFLAGVRVTVAHIANAATQIAERGFGANV